LEFVKTAFDLVGLNWKKYVKTDKRFLRPLEINYLCGDPKKAKRKLQWTPKIKFHELVEIMLDEDLKRWKMFLDGKAFAWDAPLYPSEGKIITRLSKENTKSKIKRNALRSRK
jgi:GDPmannose 4,6-dehydratase